MQKAWIRAPIKSGPKRCPARAWRADTPPKESKLTQSCNNSTGSSSVESDSGARAVFKHSFFFCKGGPWGAPTANCEPPTTNRHQPPTIVQ